MIGSYSNIEIKRRVHNNNNNNRLFPICLQIACFNHQHFLILISENGMSLNLAVIFYLELGSLGNMNRIIKYMSAADNGSV